MHLSVTVREQGRYPLQAVAPELLPLEGGGAALSSPMPATAANKQSLFISASFAGALRHMKAHACNRMLDWLTIREPFGFSGPAADNAGAAVPFLR